MRYQTASDMRSGPGSGLRPSREAAALPAAEWVAAGAVTLLLVAIGLFWFARRQPLRRTGSRA